MRQRGKGNRIRSAQSAGPTFTPCEAATYVAEDRFSVVDNLS